MYHLRIVPLVAILTVLFVSAVAVAQAGAPPSTSPGATPAASAPGDTVGAPQAGTTKAPATKADDEGPGVKVTAEATGSEGPIPLDLIAKGLVIYRGQLTYCGTVALPLTPALDGSVTLQVVYGSDGKVTTITTKADTTGSEALTDCLASMIALWKLPYQKDKTPTEVEYVFDYSVD